MNSFKSIMLIFVIAIFGFSNCTKKAAEEPSKELLPSQNNMAIETPEKPKPASLCYEHKYCETLRKLESKCRQNQKEGHCKKFVVMFERLLRKKDCKGPNDVHPIPTVFLCDQDEVEVSYPKLTERAAMTLSKLKFAKANQLYGSPLFRSILDGALAEDHRKASEKQGRLNK